MNKAIVASKSDEEDRVRVVLRNQAKENRDEWQGFEWFEKGSNCFNS